jgi:hypothetical protein
MAFSGALLADSYNITDTKVTRIANDSGATAARRGHKCTYTAATMSAFIMQKLVCSKLTQLAKRVTKIVVSTSSCC